MKKNLNVVRFGAILSCRGLFTLLFLLVTGVVSASGRMGSFYVNQIGMMGDSVVVGQQEEILMKTEVLPSFKGGNEALSAYLKGHIKYPKEAVKKKMQGRVLVKFVVKKDGSITDVSVLKGISPELDEEAKRVVEDMPRWNPGIQKGKKVNTQFVMPINFKLP